MKTSKIFNYLISVSAGALTLASVLAQSQDIVVDTFDSADEFVPWQHWWGSPLWDVSFDSAVDAGGSASSGSMLVTVEFDLAQYGGDNQFCFRKDLPAPVDGLNYQKLVMDIKVSSDSPKRASGDYGYFEYGVRFGDWSQNFFGTVTINKADEWIHLEAEIPITDPKMTNVAGVAIKMWSGGSSDGQTGTYKFWVDNVKLVAKEGPPPPPPSLSLEPFKAKGLIFTASAPGQQWQRQNICTVNPVSWQYYTEPVTYSMTIDSFPDTNHLSFQAHIFLVPFSGPPPTWENSPDWNEPNVIFVQITRNSDGSGTANFMIKTNQPNGNSMYWNGGTLATLTSSNITGTWSIKFSNNTNITMTGPDGSVTNFFISQEMSDLFYADVYAFFGVQPNSTANIGQSMSLGGIKITGIDMPIDDKFTGELNTDNWKIIASDPAGIMPVPENVVYRLMWTMPAVGFTPQVSSMLTTNSWVDITNTIATISGKFYTLITKDILPDANKSFFRLIQKPVSVIPEQPE